MKKILLIEDDQIIANIYRNKLTQEGFTVETAFDGEVGLEMVKAFRPDVVLLDLQLPKLPGLELIKIVRGLPDFATTPLLVFSNTYQTSQVQEALKAGATKCLSKASCTPRHVIDAVRSVVGLEGAVAVPNPEALEAAGYSATASSDEEFQAALRQDCLAELPGILASLRESVKKLVKAENESARVLCLEDLFRRVQPLTGNAAIAGLVHIAQMADAFEVLLKELVEKPKNLNSSTLRTVATAVDFLGFLFQFGTKPADQELPPPRILVVDDEAISRRAVTYALEKARLKSESCDDPQKALALLEAGRFDLVFLDVDMPGMNGFELCTKLRALAQHKKTPVVFVTSLNDFESRANSTMSGGNDFIGKPFLFIELAVKSLIHVLRGRLTVAK